MAGIKRYQDLECHQLAVQIRREVLRVTRREVVRRDYRFVHQIRDSARGAPRNIAEGYSRFNPAEIIPFLSYAKGSLDETQNHVEDGGEAGYLTTEETEHLLGLIARAIGAVTRWMAYLESPAARRFYEQFKNRRRNTPYEPRSTRAPRTGTKNPEPGRT